MRVGKVSSLDLAEEEYHQAFNCTYNETKCLLELPDDKGKFMIQKDPSCTQVTLEFDDPQYRQTLMSYFYGTGVSAIIHYNGQFVLHASGVSKGEGLVLFCGHSGIGKSTIAASLQNRGYRVFTDDKCLLLRDEHNRWIAKPGLQIMRLWKKTLDTVDTDDFLSDPKEVVLRKDKFQFQINPPEQITQDQSIKAIFIIQNINSDGDLELQELHGVTKMKYLKRQVFRSKMISGMGLDRQLWHFLTDILKDIPVYLVQRPKETPIFDFTQYIEDILEKI